MKLSNKPIKYIYQLADIHIRPLERHIEYREVFSKLYNKLKEDKNIKESLIVICGDIVHDKDNIKPELILLIREFLKNLSSITDVILFSGNHDLIENNTNRIPSLEALTQDICNIYYLRDTNLYKYGNINFYLKSLEDNKKLITKLNKNGINIGLYHGMLKEVNINNTEYSVKDFDIYDITLLGDIHKREVFNNKIAYSGSLIQQNHGETIEDHGMIKWNLEDISYEFIDIENEYGFITIDKYNINNITYPKYSRVRFRNDENDELKDIVKKRTKIISESFITDLIVIKESKIDKEFMNELDDIELIKEQCNENIEGLLKLHNIIKKEENIEDNELSTMKWSIEYIEFKNLFIYGDNKLNKINFYEKGGIIGVLGNNAIGKSTIINIILFILFDKISSDYNLVNVINKNQRQMYCKIVLNIGEVKYIISKQGGKQNGKRIQAKFITNFYKIENGKEINLNGEDKVKTYNYINKIIGTRDIFKLCNISSTSCSESILNMSNNDILKTFTLLLNLDRFTKLYDNINLKIKENRRDYNNNNGKLEMLENIIEEDIINKENNLKVIKNKINLLENETSNITKEIVILEIDKLEKEKKYKNLYSKIRKEIKITPNKYKNKIIKEYSEEEYIIKNNELCNHNSKLLKLKDKYKNSRIKKKYIYLSLSDVINIKDNIQIQITKEEKKIEEIDLQEIKKLKKDIRNLDYTISNEILYKDSKLLKNKILKSDYIDNIKEDIILFLDRILCNKEIIKIKKELNIKRSRLNKLEKINFKNKENIKYNIEVRKQIRLNNKNYELIKELDKVILKKQYEYHINKLILLKSELNILEYNKMLLSRRIAEDNKYIKTNINIIKKDLDEISIIYNTSINELQEKGKKLSQLKITYEYENKEYLIYKKKLKNKIDILNIIKESNYKNKLFTEYKRLVDKKCLPSLILKNKIKFIQNDINKNLSNLVEFTIKLNINDKSKFNIEVIKFGNILYPYMCSGYERFILNIIIKRSLNKYCYNNKSNLFAIDEGLDCIDLNNMKKFNLLLDRLKIDYNNILLISHIKNIKDFIDNEIIISYNSKSSMIL